METNQGLRDETMSGAEDPNKMPESTKERAKI